MLAAATGFRGFDRTPDLSAGEIAARCRRTLDAAAAKPYDDAARRHVADHQSLFRRVSLDLGATAASALPTDERLRRFAEAPDPSLVALYFQYGRYLLIASSRPGTQPANLQGIWNDDVRPPWSSNYTLNINAQMNYWPAEVCNLAECHEPLFDLIDELAANGRADRRDELRLPRAGSRTTTPTSGGRPRRSANDGWGDPTWAMWPMGGAWLCQHLWEHYAFTGDLELPARARLSAHERRRRVPASTGSSRTATAASRPARRLSPENVFLADGRTRERQRRLRDGPHARSATCSRTASRPARRSASTPTFARELGDALAPPAPATGSAGTASCRSGRRTSRNPSRATGTSRTCIGVYPGSADHAARHARARRGRRASRSSGGSRTAAATPAGARPGSSRFWARLEDAGARLGDASDSS